MKKEMELTLYLVSRGSGCGTAGRPVASVTRRPGFESRHWQFLLNINDLLTVQKRHNKEKDPIFKNNFPAVSSSL